MTYSEARILTDRLLETLRHTDAICFVTMGTEEVADDGTGTSFNVIVGFEVFPWPHMAFLASLKPVNGTADVHCVQGEGTITFASK